MRRRALLSGGNIDYSQDYFTMVVTSGGNITWTGSITSNRLYCSKDNGATWTTANSGTAISVVTGDKVLWKGTPTPQSSKGIGTFSGTSNVRYSVEGNAMSLLYGDNFKGQTSLSGKNYALCNLFNGNTNVTSAENMSLPATTLVEYCYWNMFQGCTSLTTAPKLPATKMVEYCYYNMFQGCTSLTTAPSLPATTLASSCYQFMFYNCTSLTTAPVLPATTLADRCYGGMFQGCTSLTTAPKLPATKMVEYCYYDMFSGCTSLTTAPSLPATTLASGCYYNMFSGCTSLTTPPTISATTLKGYCCYQMFYNCNALTTAPVLLATTLVSNCYNYMFYGCSSLNYIKAMFTTTPTSSYTGNWVNGVAATGTFVKNSSATWTTTGASAVPNGWTVQTASS